MWVEDSNITQSNYTRLWNDRGSTNGWPLADYTYYWRVRYKDSNGWSNWSEAWTFNVVTIKWTYQLPTTARSYSDVALGADGTIYISWSTGEFWWSAGEGYLDAVYPDGALKWRTTINTYWPGVGTPAIGADGTIYVSYTTGEYINPNWYARGNMCAINADGSIKWSIYCGAIPGAVAIATDGTIYYGGYAINPNGTIKWTGYSAGSGRNVAVGSNGNIYGACRAVNQNDGTLIWETSQTDTYLNAICPDGSIIAYQGTGSLLCINSTNGTINWTYNIRSSEGTGASVGIDGTIYATSDSGLYAINPNGSVKWLCRTGGRCAGQPVCCADGTIIVAGRDPGGSPFLFVINSDGTINRVYNNWLAETIRDNIIIGSDGTIYMKTGSYTIQAIYSSRLLANSSWPMAYHDMKHTCRVGGP